LKALLLMLLHPCAHSGESDPIKKSTEDDPWCRSGTQVSEGSGRLLVVAVGEQSQWGKTMALVSSAGSEDTPLQEKLADMASAIGKVGLGVAVACFIALFIKWCVENKGFPINKINDHGPVQFFLYAVTIVVVAVPEGLPLAVTISLAYSMKKMMKVGGWVGGWVGGCS
jgi:Ca2+-transporting ATPase